VLCLGSSPTDCTSVHIDIWRNTEVFELLHDKVDLLLIIGKSQLENLFLKLLHFSLNSIEILKNRLCLSIISNIQNKINLFSFELFNTIILRFYFNKRSNEFILLHFSYNHLNLGFGFYNFYRKMLEHVSEIRLELFGLHLPKFKITFFIVPNDACFFHFDL